MVRKRSVSILIVPAKMALLLRLGPADRSRLTWRSLLAFLFWPGLNLQPFLIDGKPGRAPRHPLWLTGLINLTAGAALLWAVPLLLPEQMPFAVRLAVAMVGVFLFSIFGFIDLQAALYRRWGFPVEKQWDNPLAASSLSDFWGQRWNRVFSDFARVMFFRPLVPRLGARGASFVVFLYAGLVHEWSWSFSAGGGYGGPLLYFLIQWLALMLEGSRFARRLLRRSLAGRLWCWLVVLAPLPLLFHPPFLERLAIPLLALYRVPRLAPPS